AAPAQAVEARADRDRPRHRKAWPGSLGGFQEKLHPRISGGAEKTYASEKENALPLKNLKNPPGIFTAYLAPTGFVHEVEAELKSIFGISDRLVLAEGTPQKSVWAQNVWLDPRF